VCISFPVPIEKFQVDAEPTDVTFGTEVVVNLEPDVDTEPLTPSILLTILGLFLI
jgi:hypothetical protein